MKGDVLGVVSSRQRSYLPPSAGGQAEGLGARVCKGPDADLAARRQGWGPGRPLPITSVLSAEQEARSSAGRENERRC